MAELNASRYGDNVLEQTQNKVFEKLDRALSEGVGIPVKLLDANTRNVRGRQVITSEPPNQNPLVQGLSNLWPF
jgi:hypothetical protein